MASFNPPPSQAAPQRAAQPAAQGGGWTWEGGTPITVGQGDTVHSLSQRYSVPVAAILQSNNLSSASAIKPGQRLVIPRYDTRLTTGSVNAPRPAASAPAAGNGQVVHTIQPGETLMKLLDTLDEHDDVQTVYANYEMSDALMEKLSAA